MTDRIDVADRLNICAAKIAFINDVISQTIPDRFHFSADAINGFHFIMGDIEDEIKNVVKEL